MRIFYSHGVSANVRRLARLAECVGISGELVDVERTSLAAALESALADHQGGWILDVASLKDRDDRQDLEAAAGLVRRQPGAVLLLVTSHGEATNRFLEILTGRVVPGMVRLPVATRVGYPVSKAGLAGELASHEYPRRAHQALTLSVASTAVVDRLMELDALPAFVHWHAERSRILVWSTARVFDVDRRLAKELEFEEAADEYVPAIIFLRTAFAGQCWHNPDPGAGLVIDDPLLRKQYGFIHFPQLLASARRKGYHVTLAFIPWNHQRSRPEDIRWFREHSGCFSICAHGCDHTNNEFRSTDYDTLLRKNFVARQRMEQHHQRTGLPCEPLMVCPQDYYSLEAMRAFADSRQFLGLVNTGCMPRDLATPQLCGADLLLAAQDSFFGFPVFKRHYWSGDMAVFAMSLFLGKPAILVAHHEFFREGPVGAEAFAAGLARLHPGLKWTSLADTVTRTHQRRRGSGGRYEVRFFTDTFRLEHQGSRSLEYRLTRRLCEDTRVRRVTVNGHAVTFTQERGELAFSVVAETPGQLEVRVGVTPTSPTKPYPSGLKYRAGVALRRGLSELRDNLITRNRVALRASTVLMEALKQTGEK